MRSRTNAFGLIENPLIQTQFFEGNDDMGFAPPPSNLIIMETSGFVLSETGQFMETE